MAASKYHGVYGARQFSPGLDTCTVVREAGLNVYKPGEAFKG